MQQVGEKKKWTDEELMVLPHDGNKYELINGDLVMTPTGFEHGEITTRLLVKLREHVMRNRLGVVLSSDVGYRLPDGDLLSPDVSFITKEKLAGSKRPFKGFPKFAPDLAVEILSPSDSKKSLRQKVEKYFANGTKLVWLIDPNDQTVEVYKSAQESNILRSGEYLIGNTLVPDFTMSIIDLFAEYDF